MPTTAATRYLRSITSYDLQGHPVISPWSVLHDFALARATVEDICRQLPDRHSEAQALCVLADSGVPLGVLVSQSLSKPLHLYCRAGRHIENEPGLHFIYPPIHPGSTAVLFDSHITTGFTSNTCYDLLSNHSVNVSSVVTALSFRDLPGVTANEREVGYWSLATGAELRESLSGLFPTDDWSNIGYSLTAATKRRHAPVGKPSCADEEIPALSRPSRLGVILRSWLPGGNGGVQSLDDEIGARLSPQQAPAESDVWRFFCDPDLVKEVCLSFGRRLDLSTYDVIVGTDYLGLFLALALAWHNNYEGRVLSTLRPREWEALRGHSGRGLICTARIRTGDTVRGAAHMLRRYAHKPSQVAALWVTNKGMNFPRNRALVDFQRRGLDVLAAVHNGNHH